MAMFDTTSRHKTDRMAVLDTRGSGPVSSRLTWLNVENFPGSLDLHGISVLSTPKSNVLRMLLINHRPPQHHKTGKLLAAERIGANTTIEHFITEIGSSNVRHVRTHSHDLIQTPNAVQWVNDHAFVFTNDHGYKTGLVRLHTISLLIIS